MNDDSDPTAPATVAPHPGLRRSKTATVRRGPNSSPCGTPTYSQRNELLELIEGEILYRHPEVGGPERRPFANAEYHALAWAEILAPDERVQLIAGDIIVMSPVGNVHATCVTFIHDELFVLKQMERANIRTQNPLVMPDNSEPEPDAMLLAWREDGYAFRAPHPEDVLLLVEVSDSTLGYDRNVKMQLYAAAGVPEAWLVNLRDGLDRIQHTAYPGRLPRHPTIRTGAILSRPRPSPTSPYPSSESSRHARKTKMAAITAYPILHEGGYE